MIINTLPEARIHVLLGHYGSGKTQISINQAIQLANEAKEGSVALVDLDIVNPYFRSREMAKKLENKGIRCISSHEGFSLGEAPALSPIIDGVIDNKEFTVIIDVGGDDTGAKALGRFADKVRSNSARVWMVVNTFRPETESLEKIGRMKETLEAASGLEVNGLIHNSHLASATTIEDIVARELIIQEYIKKVKNIEKVICIERQFIYKMKDYLVEDKIFPIDLFLKPIWIKE